MHGTPLTDTPALSPCDEHSTDVARAGTGGLFTASCTCGWSATGANRYAAGEFASWHQWAAARRTGRRPRPTG